MANLYDKAGLVNIPVGYQEGFLYNIKPTDNTLAFRFNRDSAATRVNKEGLIEQVGYFGPELITNGDFATDSNWSKGTGWTISGGTAVSDGSNTSGEIIAQTINIVSGKTYQVVLDVKEVTSGNVRFYSNFLGGGGQANINSSGIFTYNLEASATGGKNVGIQALASSSSVINSISIKEVLGDKPRIDYTDSLTSPSFLLEPQSVNKYTYSQDFSQIVWNKTNATVSTSTITDPTGGQNSFKLVPDSGTGGNRSLGINFTGLSGLHTQTVFAKKGEYNYIMLRTRNAPITAVMFDLENGTFNVNATSAAFDSAKIEDYGDGWFRCSMTLDPSQMTVSGQIFTSFSVGITGSETNSFNGDGTSGIYIFGAQFEALSFPTSYIPTAGSTVTRAQETCNGAGSSSTFNSTEGVLYAEIAALVNDSSVREISLSDGTANNRIELRYGAASNRLQLVARSSGSVQASISNSDYNILLSNKVAVKYKANDFALWINGVEVGTDTSGNAPSGLSELAFDDGNGTSDFYGKTKGVYVFNEALTDDELQQLTGPEYNSFAALAAAYNYTVI